MEQFPCCPICFELIVEPVTLPCEHELCLSCFKQNLCNANFSCSLCRKRISSWARQHTKDPVNLKRKCELETFYAKFGSVDDVKLAVRLQKEENERLTLSKDCCGEIGLEYQSNIIQIREEKDKLDKLSEKQAIELIKQEQEFESKVVTQLKEDETIAKELADELMREQDGQIISQIEADHKFAIELDKSWNLSPCTVHIKKEGKQKANSLRKTRNSQPAVKLTKWFTPQPNEN